MHALSIREQDDRHQAVCACGYAGETWLDREIAEMQAVEHLADAAEVASSTGEEGR